MAEQCLTGYKKQLIDELNAFAKNNFAKDESTRKNKFVKLLLNLSDIYKGGNFKLEDLIDDINEYLESDDYNFLMETHNDIDAFSFLGDNIAEDINNMLSTIESNRVAGLNRTSGESKDDSLDVFDREEKSKIQSIFLSDYFPPTSTSRRFFIDNFRRTLSNKIFKGGGLLNSEEVTKNLNDWKRDLLDEFIGDGDNLGLFERAFNVVLNLTTKLEMRRAFGSIDLPIILKNMEEFRESEILLSMTSIERNGTPSDKLKIKAYQTYVILKEFNNLVNNTFEGVIKIQRGLQSSDDKYSFILGDKSEKSWIDKESDEDQTKFLSSIPIRYLESLNIFSRNGNKLNDRYLSFNNVKLAFGGMYAFTGSYEGNTIIPVKKSLINGNWVGNFLEKNDALEAFYGKERLLLIQTLFENKTLSQILSIFEKNPVLYFPALLTVLNHLVTNTDVFDEDSKFRKNSKNAEVIRSLFWNIVGQKRTDTSLINSLPEKALKGPNIYSMLAIMSTNIKNSVSIEYVELEDGIKAATLLNNSSDRQYRKFLAKLNILYNSKKPVVPVNYSLSFNSFKKENIGDSPRIRIKLDDDIELEYGRGKLGEEIFKVLENGKEVKEINSWIDANTEKYRIFLKEVFNNVPFDRDLLYDLCENKSGLLKLAAKTLYRSEVNRYTLKLENVSTEKSFLKEAKKLLPSGQSCAVVPYSDMLTLAIIDDHDYVVAKSIQTAQDIALNFIHDNIAKDGENKAISTLQLPNLDALVHSIWNQNNHVPGSPLEKLSIYNLVRGIEYIRDFSSYSIKRNGTKFSDRDFFIANFIYDYCASIYNYKKDDEGELKKVEKLDLRDLNIFRLMGLVISDKSKLLKLVSNWLDTVEIDGKKVALKDLSLQDLISLIKRDFGTYYTRVFNYINDQWDIVNKAIQSDSLLARNFREKYSRTFITQGKEFVRVPQFNFNDNFLEVNDFLVNNPDISISDFIHDAVAVAQQLNPNVEITEGVMYVKGGGIAKGRKISNNAPLIHLLYMYESEAVLGKDIKTDCSQYSVRENFDAFYRRKNLQLVTELLEIFGNKSVSLAGNSASLMAAKDVMTEYDREGNPEKYWFTRDVENDLIIAKIKSGGSTINVTSKLDIKNWYWYNRMVEKLFRYGIPEELDVEKHEFNLQKTLSAVYSFRIRDLMKFQFKEEVNAVYGYNFDTDEGINSIINTIIPEENRAEYLGKDIIGKKRLLCRDIYASRIQPETEEEREQKIKDRYNEVTGNEELWPEERINNYINNYLIESYTDPEIFHDYLLLHSADNLDAFKNKPSLKSLKNKLKELQKLQLDNAQYIEDPLVGINPEIYEKIRDVKEEAYKLLKELKLKENPSKEILNSINFLEKEFIPRFRSINEYVSGIDYEINPELLKHNYLDFLISQEYQLATVGSVIAHPCKFKEDVREMEAELYGQSVKRNVSMTASVHKEIPSLLNGIRSKLKIAVIEDSIDFITTYGGDKGKIKVYDGASIYNPFMNELDNNSLGADAMGVDKKSFGHSLNSKSGIGFILKNAGFPITNQRMRMSNNLLDRILHKKMNNISWSSHKNFNKWKGWTKDWDGNNLTEDLKIYFKDELGNIKFRTGFAAKEGDISKTTFLEGTLKEIDGRLVESGVSEGEMEVNSNYQLWELFGGANSGTIVNNSTFEYDESSIKNVVTIMNNTGVRKIKRGERVISQDDVDQILKQSMIDICATEGAVKFGATNINSNKAFIDPDYVLTYMEIETFDFGEQLNAEHSAAEGHVSLMTQVVNALGARGYSLKEARRCYEALKIVTDSATENELEGLKNLKFNNPKKLLEAITTILFKALKKLKGAEGDILSAVANSIIEASRGKIDIKDLDIPISHPAIFNKMVSEVASYLEKAAVRVKAEGNQLVLNPSNGRIHLIGNNTAGYYLNHMGELYDLLSKLDNLEVSIGNINPGHNYKIGIYDEDGNIDHFEPLIIDGKVVHNLDDPTILYRVLDKVANREIHLFEQVTTEVLRQIIDGKVYYGNPLGRDLGSYECKFFNTRGEEFNLWELKSVRDMVISQVNIRNKIEVEKNKEILKEARSKYLEDLNSLTDGINNQVLVERNGEIIAVDVDKSKTHTKSYEAVFPKDFFYDFDIDRNDTLLDVLSKPNYFSLRMLKKLISPIFSNSETKKYDLELKSFDGRHVFLGISDGRNTIDGSLQAVPIEVDFEGEIAYRIIDGKRTNIAIPYKIINGKPEFTISIYKNPQGFEFYYGEEKDLADLLNTLDYDLIVLEQNNVVEDEDGNAIINEGIKNILETVNNDKTIDCLENDGYWFYDEDVNDLIKVLEKLDRGIPFDGLKEKEKDLFNDYKEIINKGNRVMTSFKAALEAIVSRTPAQSQQSFMAMTISALSDELTNSMYVSRMLIYLQGSDYDIDKASVLGLKTINGEIITWSEYFNLNSSEAFDISKKFPFPTRLELNIQDNLKELDKVPFEVMENNLSVNRLGNTYIFHDEENNTLSIDIENDVTIRVNNMPLLKLYYLLNSALKYLKDRIEGKSINVFTDSSDDSKQLIESIFSIATTDISDIKSGTTKYIGKLKSFEKRASFDIFNKALLGKKLLEKLDRIYGTLGNEKALRNYIKNHIDTIGKQIILLIETYNDLGYVSGKYGRLIKAIADIHNIKTFKNPKKIKNASLNYLSITMKDISKSPINLVLAQQGIDVWADKIKDFLKDPRFSKLARAARNLDVGTIVSRIMSMTRTLTGKETVGIAASAMKVFEAMSLYYYQTLENGSLEQLEALLIHREICGKPIGLIANSYTRNILNIKSEKVKLAYEKINQDVDAFLIISALLSLATDNAKDPALSKLNAGSGMMGCYIAGVVLGVPMENLVELMISDTGLLIDRLSNGDIFNNDQGFRGPEEVIQYLELGKSVYDLLNNLGFLNILKLIGLYDKTLGEKGNPTLGKLKELLYNIGYRKILRKALLKALKTSDADQSFPLDTMSLLSNLIRSIESDNAYYRYNKRKEENERRILELTSKESRTEEEISELNKLEGYKKEYESLANLLLIYKNVRKSENFSSLLGTNPIDGGKFKTFLDLASVEVNVSTMQWYPKIRLLAKELIEWMDYRDIVESDYTDAKYSPDEKSHRILNQIKELTAFNLEMGALRSILALNQGLPNSLLDQMSFLMSFSEIINNRIQKAGKPEDETLINLLKAANEYLRSKGKTNVQDSQVSLYAFASHEQVEIDGTVYDYSDIVKNLYQQIKYAVNIFDVIDNVDHYKGYLLTLAIETKGLEVSSFVYRKSLEISEKVIPSLNLPYKYRDQVSRNVRFYITRKINNDFLLTVDDGKKSREIKNEDGAVKKGGIVYTIPAFDIVDDVMVQKTNGETIDIVLGRPEDNEIFKMWMNLIVIPSLQKTNSQNKFLQEISLISYQYTIDHTSQILWGKKRGYNKEIKEDAVELDLIKKGMVELEETNKGILDALFLYNLISYGFSPGESSFTELFDELILTNSLPLASEYNKYISNLDDDYVIGDSSLDTIIDLNNKDDLTELQIAVAPLIRGYLPPLSIPFIWYQRADTKEIVLLQKNKNMSSQGENEASMSQSQKIDYEIRQNKYLEVTNPFKVILSKEEANLLSEDPDKTVIKLNKNISITTDDKTKLENTFITYKGEEIAPKDFKALLKLKGYKWKDIFPSGWKNDKKAMAHKIKEIMENKDPNSSKC